MANDSTPISECKIDEREKGEPFVVINIDSKKCYEFVDIVLCDCSLNVSLSCCEDQKPISSENILYAYPLAFYVVFSTPLCLSRNFI